jgi:hypothetical protein
MSKQEFSGYDYYHHQAYIRMQEALQCLRSAQHYSTQEGKGDQEWISKFLPALTEAMDTQVPVMEEFLYYLVHPKGPATDL